MDNLVYLLSFNRCGIQHVGETWRDLRVCMQEHIHAKRPDLALPTTKGRQPSNVAKHFSRNQHTAEDVYMYIQILELIPNQGVQDQ